VVHPQKGQAIKPAVFWGLFFQIAIGLESRQCFILISHILGGSIGANVTSLISPMQPAARSSSDYGFSCCQCRGGLLAYVFTGVLR
jgi:hypothetical protein